MSTEIIDLVENSKIGMIGNMTKKGSAYLHFIYLPVLKKQNSHKMIIRGRVIVFSLVNIANIPKNQENKYKGPQLDNGLPSAPSSLDLVYRQRQNR